MDNKKEVDFYQCSCSSIFKKHCKTCLLNQNCAYCMLPFKLHPNKSECPSKEYQFDFYKKKCAHLRLKNLSLKTDINLLQQNQQSYLRKFEDYDQQIFVLQNQSNKYRHPHFQSDYSELLDRKNLQRETMYDPNNLIENNIQQHDRSANLKKLNRVRDLKFRLCSNCMQNILQEDLIEHIKICSDLYTLNAANKRICVVCNKVDYQHNEVECCDNLKKLISKNINNSSSTIVNFQVDLANHKREFEKNDNVKAQEGSTSAISKTISSCGQKVVDYLYK